MAARLFNVRKIQRSGGSQQVTIPRDICEVMNFRPADRVYVYVVGGVVCLRKMDEGGFAAGVVAVSPPPGIDIEVG
jgi:bifunctional DNA-binding transcriptional regulator/antitoxin component of YhaV-PrlF toxin-antitoxin module